MQKSASSLHERQQNHRSNTIVAIFREKPFLNSKHGYATRSLFLSLEELECLFGVFLELAVGVFGDDSR